MDVTDCIYTSILEKSMYWIGKVTQQISVFLTVTLLKKSQIYVINRLNSIELYAMQKDYSDNSKPTSQVYFESLFKTALDWTEICLMPQKATISTRMVTKKVAIPLECFNIKWQCIIYK